MEWVGRASEGLPHLMHWLHGLAVLARSARPCALQKPCQVSGGTWAAPASAAAAQPIKETRVIGAVLSSSSTPRPEERRLAKDCGQGHCDCRATATALAVALNTATGSLTVGRAAGMSLGTLWMGGTLGPSSVSRIPERRMEDERESAGPGLLPGPLLLCPRLALGPLATYPPPPYGRQNADTAGRACAGLPGCHRGVTAGWDPPSGTPTLPPRAIGIQPGGPLPPGDMGRPSSNLKHLWALPSCSEPAGGGQALDRLPCSRPPCLSPSLPCAGWTAPQPAARRGRKGHAGGCCR